MSYDFSDAEPASFDLIAYFTPMMWDRDNHNLLRQRIQDFARMVQERGF